MTAETPQESREGAPNHQGPPRDVGVFTLAGDWIHGRFYGKTKKYLFPIDSEECNRIDITHKVFLVAQDELDYLEYAMPLGKKHKILDLGAGTGIWAINILEKYTDAEVLAVDFNGIQPQMIPSGMRTSQFDIEEPLWYIPQDFNFAHLRLLYGSIQTDLWPSVYRNIYKHLTPEIGWIEHSELDFTPKWDTADTPQPSHFKKWCEEFLKALDERGRSARIDPVRTKRQLEEAGFVDIKEEKLQYCVSPWSREPKAKELGRWLNLSLVSGFKGLSLRPMCGEKDGDRMSVKDCLDLCELAEKEICVLRYRAFITLHTWRGRKPKSK